MTGRKGVNETGDLPLRRVSEKLRKAKRRRAAARLLASRKGK